MFCRITDLRNKEVICKNNGIRLGCADDVEIDTKTSRIIAIVIFGRLKCFGLMGRMDDIVIPWENIALIGEDTILVDIKYDRPKRRRPKLFV